MKLFELAGNYGRMNIYQLEQVVEQTIKNIPNSSFKVDTKLTKSNAQFGDVDTWTFTIDVVNSRGGEPEDPGQNSSSKLFAGIRDLFQAFRNEGLLFTQPQGVWGSMREDDRYSTAKVQFVVGPKG